MKVTGRLATTCAAFETESHGSVIDYGVSRSSGRGGGKGGTSGLVEQMRGIGRFVRRLRTKMRFGKLSRAPLRLLRLQVCGGTAECDWMARPADEWDTDLRGSVREHNAASQALEDAIAVRELLFSVLSEVSSAEFHVYRTAAMAAPELIIAGTVTREEEAGPDTHSLAMRAKLCGFHFSLNDGGLQALELGKRQPLA